MTGTALHACLANLTSIWTGVVAGMQTSDGPAVDPTVFYLAVGYAGRTMQGTPGVTTERDFGNASSSKHTETHLVQCVMSNHVGDPSQVPATREAMFAAFDQLETALRANRTLSLPAVTDTGVVSLDLEQDIAETGSYLYLHIGVRIDTYS